MKVWQGLFLTALLLVASARAEEAAEEGDDYGGDERAHLIVRKYVKEDVAVQGRNLTVHVDVYNAGVRLACTQAAHHRAGGI